ncbi:hypothetical protein EON65_23440 [archaeon]|nr:MAG: hypothetical protein EON65_23440 [archaeon]
MLRVTNSLHCCSLCLDDISVNMRLHCDTCKADYCDACYRTYGVLLSHHPLHIVHNRATALNVLTDEQLLEQTRDMRYRLRVLQHAVSCSSICVSRICARMKECLSHSRTCTMNVKGGCKLCMRLANIIVAHTRTCQLEQCKVPRCNSIRDHIRSELHKFIVKLDIYIYDNLI